MSRLARVRRAFTLHAHWQDGDLVLENYSTRIAVSADPITIRILTFFGRWRRRESIGAELPQFSASSIRTAIADLIDSSLLIEEGSDEARLESAIVDTWRHWLPHGSFHFATKDAAFATQRQWRRMARAFQSVAPQPPLTKAYPRAPRRDLPAPAGTPDEFTRVLLARKTHRDFSRAPLPLDALAALLHYTWGAMGVVQSPNFGPLLHKTSPSGGARHPGEVYVAALRVKHLPRGIYHYNIRNHSLELVKKGLTRRELLRYSLGQTHVGNACAVCFMTAVFPRSMYKYRSPRAYRIITLDAGHLAQTFCLVATWLGLAPFTTAALADTAIERALGLDGVTESILYVAGIGLPKARQAGSRSPLRAVATTASWRRPGKATKARRTRR